jgi:tripartite-type tricarboxylate transporter receptor subunit TctC
VRIVVPFLPGGIVDTLARLIGTRLQASMGQPFVAENRPGAGGNVGTALVARAKGDPYTLLLGSSGPLAVSPILEQNLGYDPLTDLAPIILIAATPLVLTVPAASPYRDLKGMMCALRKARQEILYPTPGIGSPQLLAGEAFRQRAGFAASPVHYTGSAPVITALIAGEMPYTFENLLLVLPHIRAGTLRAIAVTSRERAALLPEVPTMEEAGLEGFEARGWYGLLAPAGVPEAITHRLNAETAAALRSPDIAQRVAEMGSPSIASSPEDFRALIASETRKWRAVLEAGNSGATMR